MQNTRRVVQVSTNIAQQCQVDGCNEWIDGTENFTGGVNHYIEQHGFNLLHVGQESAHAQDGLWHLTVAVLGEPDE